jgi:hypothetical protein
MLHSESSDSLSSVDPPPVSGPLAIGMGGGVLSSPSRLHNLSPPQINLFSVHSHSQQQQQQQAIAQQQQAMQQQQVRREEREGGRLGRA